MLLPMFEHEKAAVVDAMLRDLLSISKIQAIVLGGSYARKTAHAESDIDLGLYYAEQSPPSIQEIKQLAMKYDVRQAPVVTELYEWGRWVNGGAWIQTKVGKIDWLYRNIDQVNRVIADANQGRFEWDYRQQPPYGYFSITYLADVHQNIPLYDPQAICKKMQQSIKNYPEALRRSVIQEHLWSVEFSLAMAKKYATRNCIYETAGCMTRIAVELIQVLFALNRVFFAADKQSLQAIESFPCKPQEFEKKSTSSWGAWVISQKSYCIE